MSVAPRSPVFCTLALLALGIGLRAAAFAGDRALWIDEAMIALNVVDRSPAGLFEPLDRNQGGPVGFLIAAKASAALFGPTERALRLPAFLASLAGLLAFAAAARRLLPGPAARLALALFAVSPHLVSYAAECKQYSGDAAAAAVLLALAAPLFGPATRRQRLAFGLAGAIAIWCSHPALFVLAGFGVALSARACVRRDRAGIAALFPLGALWLASFAGVYFANLRHLGGNDYLLRYWADHFAPVPASRSGLAWYAYHALTFVHFPAGLAPDLLLVQASLVAAGLTGAVVAWRRGATAAETTGAGGCGAEAVPSPWLAAALALGVACALAASAARSYPFAGRLLMFLVPAACLVAGAAADGLRSLAAPRLGRWSRAVGPILLAWPTLQAIDEIRHPARSEEIRPLLRAARDGWRPGDRIYVYGGAGDAGAGPAFEFYTRRREFPDGAAVRGGVHRGDPAAYGAEIARLPPGRIWVLFAHRHRDEEAEICAAFAAAGTGGRVLDAPGASLHLYELRGGPLP